MDKSIIEVGYQDAIEWVSPIQKYQSGFQGNQEFLWVLNGSEIYKQSQQ